MNMFLIRAAALAALTLPVAACYSRVDNAPAPTPIAVVPSAVLVSPTTPTLVPSGSVIVKPY